MTPVAVVTGAARGIGRETVRLLVARGAQVVALMTAQADAAASLAAATRLAEAATGSAAGFVLACQSHPVTDTAEIDFDV